MDARQEAPGSVSGTLDVVSADRWHGGVRRPRRQAKFERILELAKDGYAPAEIVKAMRDFPRGAPTHDFVLRVIRRAWAEGDYIPPADPEKRGDPMAVRLPDVEIQPQTHDALVAAAQRRGLTQIELAGRVLDAAAEIVDAVLDDGGEAHT